MRGLKVPHKAYVNICGTDIIRDEVAQANQRVAAAKP